MLLQKGSTRYLTLFSTDSSTTALLLKIAVSTADYYESAYEDLTIPPLDLCYGETFLERIRAKSLLYFSLAQFYKSQELHETSHYGEEVARLGLSFDLARKAKESVKLFPLEFSDEVLIYLRRVELALKSATKDNSTIYHERVPEYHSLSILPRATLAVSSFPAFLLQSNKAELGLFRSLLPYGIKLLSDMYSKKKQNIISLATSNVNESEESIRWYGAFSFKSSNLNLYEKLYSNPEVLENLEKMYVDVKTGAKAFELERDSIFSALRSCFARMSTVSRGSIIARSSR